MQTIDILIKNNIIFGVMVAGKTKKKLIIAVSVVLVFAFSIFAFLSAGYFAAHLWKPCRPDYEKADLTATLSKSFLDESDYGFLYRQTGLTKLGVDGLVSEGKTERIYEIQNDFFGDNEFEKDTFGPFLCWEKRKSDKEVARAELENGDIIVSSSTHFSCFRFGHAAIVIDAEKGIVAESAGYDSPSFVDPCDFFNRPSFMILRLKADKETRQKIADYAKETLVGVDYSIFCGIFTKKYEEGKPTKSQCAHLVWYAFKHFGIDIDSNGGAIVLPKDIANSDELELVQNFGFDLDKLWR